MTLALVACPHFPPTNNTQLAASALALNGQCGDFSQFDEDMTKSGQRAIGGD